MHPRLVGRLAALTVADGLDPVGVAGAGGRRVGVGRGGIPRVRHQGGRVRRFLAPQDLIARDRTGVLHGSVPGQDDLPVSQYGGEAGGGQVRRVGFRLRRRRGVDMEPAGALAHPVLVDGLDAVGVGGAGRHCVVGVGGGGAARVRHQFTEVAPFIVDADAPQDHVAGY